jgi:O-antigen/teichoic acid export membrane protein
MIGGAMAVAVPAGIVGVGLAHPLVWLFYGPTFAAAAAPLALWIVILVLVVPLILLTEALNAAGHQLHNLTLLIVTTLVTSVGLVILVPRGGAVGASIALLVGYAVYTFASAGLARRLGASESMVRAFGPATAAAAVGAGVLVVTSGLGPLASSVLAGVCALTAIGMLGSGRRDLLALLAQLRQQPA